MQKRQDKRTIYSWEQLVQVVYSHTLIAKYNEISLFAHSFEHEKEKPQWHKLCRSYLPQFYCLKKLDLSCCNITDDLLAIEFLPQIKSLTELVIAGNLIHDTGASYIGNYMEKNQNLLSLNLRNNYIGDKGLSYISKALSNHKALNFLDLSSNTFNAPGLKILYHSLKSNNSLSFLKIGSNSLKHCFMLIAELITHSKQLKSLDLWNNLLGLEEIGKKLIFKSSSLTEINLSCNRIKDRDATQLVSALASNNIITSIDLSNNFIEDEGGGSIAGLISSNNNLKYLNISDNNMTITSCCLIVSSLEKCKTLCYLNFTRNNLNNMQCKILYRQIEKIMKYNNQRLSYQIQYIIYSTNGKETNNIYIFPHNLSLCSEEDNFFQIFNSYLQRRRERDISYYTTLNTNSYTSIDNESNINDYMGSQFNPPVSMLMKRKQVSKYSLEYGNNNEENYQEAQERKQAYSPQQIEEISNEFSKSLSETDQSSLSMSSRTVQQFRMLAEGNSVQKKLQKPKGKFSQLFNSLKDSQREGI